MRNILFLSLITLLFIGACATPEQEVVPEPEVIIDPIESIDLSLLPNEAGQIMVLMYHAISEEEGVWARTPDNFRKDLQTLYDQGYRPISLTDFVLGHINTEAGKTPVVITFDDGRINNFKYLEDGSIDPDCAVGILVQFHEAHPDFPLEASFFLTESNFFGQSQFIAQKLNYLIDQGMDVGNHTQTHVNFTKVSTQEEMEREIGGQAQIIESYITSEYSVNTMALTYGSRPKDEALKPYLAQGSYEGIPYENIVLLNVGSNPSKSPYHLEFNPLSVPRIRASETDTEGLGLYDYLESFIQHPERRYISDGVIEIVTVPSQYADQVRVPESYQLNTYE